MNSENQPEESKTRGDKIPKHELDKRIFKVVSMIEEGQSRSSIIEQCCAEYSVSRSTVDRYIESANDHFRETFKPQIRRFAEIAKRRLETIYFKAMEKEDLKTALAALTQLSRMQGLWNDYIMRRHRYEISDNEDYDERPLNVMRR